MKKLTYYILCCLLALSLLVFKVSSISALETDAILIPEVEIILPGVERTITIESEGYPADYSQILVFVLGYGGVDMRVSSNEDQGNYIVLTGMGISSAGTIPFYKFGPPQVTITETIEIGDERRPFGILWITSWILSWEGEPPYSYTLTIKF